MRYFLMFMITITLYSNITKKEIKILLNKNNIKYSSIDLIEEKNLVEFSHDLCNDYSPTCFKKILSYFNEEQRIKYVIYVTYEVPQKKYSKKRKTYSLLRIDFEKEYAYIPRKHRKMVILLNNRKQVEAVLRYSIVIDSFDIRSKKKNKEVQKKEKNKLDNMPVKQH